MKLFDRVPGKVFFSLIQILLFCFPHPSYYKACMKPVSVAICNYKEGKNCRNVDLILCRFEPTSCSYKTQITLYLSKLLLRGYFTYRAFPINTLPLDFFEIIIWKFNLAKEKESKGMWWKRKTMMVKIIIKFIAKYIQVLVEVWIN